MRNYLCILLRNQFTFWYRFGYIKLHKSQLIPFNGEISSKEKKIIFKEFLDVPFEYDEEYLIFHIIAPSKFTIQNIEIQQIRAIYPLTENARISISNKIDSRIKLANPFFELSEMEELEWELDKKEREKAIPILWKLCKIEKDYRCYLDKLGASNLERAIKHRSIGQKPNEIHKGNYLDYLYTYDRTAYYLPTKIGYFQDAIAILMHYSFQKNTENKNKLLPEQAIEERPIFQFLLNKSKENKGTFRQLFKFINTQEKYVENSRINGLNFHIITPLFLMLKDEMIRNNNDLSKTLLLDEHKLEILLKEYKDDFYYVIILFSYFFGYKYIYNSYYDNLNLSIFKDNNNLKYLINSIQVYKSNFLEEEPSKYNKKTVRIQEDPEKRKKNIIDFIENKRKGNILCIQISEIKDYLKNKGFKQKLSDNELRELYPNSDITKEKNKKYICFMQEQLDL
ncbi:hypothetical protein [Haemophilus paraphrohaemolyticus]|mgnify:CR=1 FL=1|uniref:hypothetical protein n=1 Tax=Haemophilus paraphrohaemolyticus TaxID=736 RepID=UPI0028F0B026|nr:hypothetical protein [Haemophilus paraphrohaemolyticus]